MKNAAILFTLSLFTALMITSCATFQGEIPISSTLPEKIYISPANMDGKLDNLEIPVAVPDLEGLFIAGFRFVVADAEGVEIHRVEETTVVKRGYFANTDRPVQIPESLVWDGKFSDGSWAPDGSYFFTIEAWDSSNNRGVTPKREVIVDNTAPLAEALLPYTLFSPNGDGNLDKLSLILRKASYEESWNGKFVNSDGNAVKTVSWAGLPKDLEWDGSRDAGGNVPDGVYSFVLSSTDRGENSFSTTVKGIVVDTQASGVGISTDLTRFSPNGDGKLDTITLIPVLQRTNGIKTLSMSVINEEGKSVRQLNSGTSAADTVFDGKADDGTILADGQYFAKLAVVYQNGDKPETFSESFYVDNTPPYIVLRAEYRIFSPNGDGRKDELTIFQSSSLEAEWTGRLLDVSSNVILSAVWKERALPFTWNGTDLGNNRLTDGTYAYEISSTDEAGNSTTRRLEGIMIDTRPTPVTVKTETSGFSPNNDSIQEAITFTWNVSLREGITGWSFDILNEKKDLVTSKSGYSLADLPEIISWDGNDSEGVAEDGWYFARLSVDYEKGDLGSFITEQFFNLDTMAPKLKIESSPHPFSPDNDGTNDVLNIVPTLEETNAVASWTIAIVDPYGNTFRRYAGQGKTVKPIAWDGKSASGELVQSAEDYTIQFTAVDEYGNRSETVSTLPVDILVIREGDRYRIAVSSILFKRYTADYLDVPADVKEKNLKTLDRLAVVLKKYSGYNIRLEGHAGRVFWDKTEQQWLREEEEVLVPLSLERAEVIKKALVQRGISASRMTTHGHGGWVPLFPHSDEQNRWKNRRVEFILNRK